MLTTTVLPDHPENKNKTKVFSSNRAMGNSSSNGDVPKHLGGLNTYDSLKAFLDSQLAEHPL